jgi:hypothetical protein
MNDPSDYFITEESPLGTCHRRGTFDGGYPLRSLNLQPIFRYDGHHNLRAEG